MMLELRPTLRLSLDCTVCGRAIGLPDHAADQERIESCSQLPSNAIVVECPKCGNMTRNKRVVNRVLKRRSQ